jgi:hypothetical protein
VAISFHSLRLLVVGVGGVQICLTFKILVWGILLNIFLFFIFFFTDTRGGVCGID